MTRTHATPPAVSQQADGATDLDVIDVVTCQGCPHPVATHDAVDTRFCRATIARALTRGCTCRTR